MSCVQRNTITQKQNGQDLTKQNTLRRNDERKRQRNDSSKRKP